MINYYEKLNIEKDSSAEEITEELKKLERAWMRRIMQQPEKAQEMLSLISEAKEVFRSEESRKEYDDSLDGGGDEEPVDTRRQNYEKWHASAKNFYDSKQYDLAQSAIVKARQYRDGQDESGEYCWLEAKINYESGDYSLALSCINDAIIMEPMNPNYLITKSHILWKQNEDIKAIQNMIDAANMANAAGNTDLSGIAQGYCAQYFWNIAKYDKAEIWSSKSMQNGDPLGLGKKIHDLINSPILHNVSKQEIDEYTNEKYCFGQQNKELIKKIVSNSDNADRAWLIIQKDGIWESDQRGEEERYTYSYFLKPDGEFLLQKRTVSWSRYSGSKTHIENIQLEDSSEALLAETDFEGSFSWSGDDFLHRYYNFDYVKGRIGSEWGSVSIRRKGYKKGLGLNIRLQEIANDLERETEKGWSKFLETVVAEEERERKEAEAKRKAEEEAERKRREAEAAAERKRKAKEEAERKAKEEAKRKAKEEAKRRAEEEEYHRRQTWKSQGRCMHCGGNFKGLLTKKCINCGREKDY